MNLIFIPVFQASPPRTTPSLSSLVMPLSSTWFPLSPCALRPSSTSPLTSDQIKCVQKIVGTLLYYGRAVDSTLLTALSAIAARQSNGTQAVPETAVMNVMTAMPQQVQQAQMSATPTQGSPSMAYTYEAPVNM